jgi:probable addiction module antidote protein
MKYYTLTDLEHETFRDPAMVEAYLEEAAKEGPEGLLDALRRVVEAQGGVSWLSRKTGLNRPGLHRVLSKGGNPTLFTLHKVANALGLGLRLVSQPRTRNRTIRG